MAFNEVFQYSIVPALMDGVASRGIPVAKLLSHGDHGLGTFRYMVGEMILFDGRLWQMKCDGTVEAIDVADENIIAPFAMVTRFRPTTRTTGVFSSKQDLAAKLSDLFPDANNLFVALRMEGRVKSITVRTTAGQQRPGQRLAEIGENQVEHTFSGEGTIIGFRSPEYTQGIGVAGIHLHFITADEKQGGHVLTLETEEIELQAAVMSRLHLELPTDDPDFNVAPLVADVKAIAKVEG